MRILVIEDYADTARVIGQSIVWFDRYHGQGVVESVSVIPDLERALGQLSSFDAVLCDGRFPKQLGAQPEEAWAIVASCAESLRIPCVVYSADLDIVRKATACGLRAFLKPTPIKLIYTALVGATRCVAQVNH
jgi:hypothetical protein